MTEPMRIRAQAADGQTTVRVLMAHEMESGQRKGPSGDRVPAWHITEVSATRNGQPVFAAQWGPAISKNPLLQFILDGGQAGDTIRITWKDNRGQSRSDEATVT
ncbi:MAG: thiosulfate oxidation carrier complex protein SoxZ [Comamonadaceae bacterium]|nr:thiosulfate oxidation carrier complex protein SoxZ [Comamonadaceae bacterium]